MQILEREVRRVSAEVDVLFGREPDAYDYAANAIADQRDGVFVGLVGCYDYAVGADAVADAFDFGGCVGGFPGFGISFGFVLIPSHMSSYLFALRGCREK
jgi:hypothetical protein